MLLFKKVKSARDTVKGDYILNLKCFHMSLRGRTVRCSRRLFTVPHVEMMQIASVV